MAQLNDLDKDFPKAPSISEAFLYWFKLGLISFGGPAGQIAIMHRDLVEQKRWISDKRFLHALNYCMLLPGPEAQQLATYIGWLMHGVPGGLIAGSLFVLPSLVMLIGLSYLYVSFVSLPVVAGLLYGIKPAVVAIVLFAAYRIGMRVLKNRLLWLIALSSFVAIAILQLSFPLIIALAAATGWLANRFFPDLMKVKSGHASKQTDYGKAVIDDETSTPSHALFTWRRLVRTALIGILIWSAVMIALRYQFGESGILTQMGWFFTKAALMTFGGAYAVLPYVYQGAVTHYAWLSPTQMIDGLALGESTPGPLIMVVAYVGFLGGWNNPITGNALTDAVMAACVVTFFTFLPSFIFIFMGGPVIESTKHQVQWHAPLNAISAAVVGVIVSLGVFFAYHVFLPAQQPRFDAVDWLAVAAAIIAFFALYRWKWGVVKLIGVYAFLGLLLGLLR